MLSSVIKFLKSKFFSKVLLVVTVVALVLNFANWVNYGGATNLGFTILCIFNALMLIFSIVFGPDE
jgi:hypothetical protein